MKEQNIEYTATIIVFIQKMLLTEKKKSLLYKY